eukprot:361128-Chlamydomonas_euryale.AAC.2
MQEFPTHGLYSTTAAAVTTAAAAAATTASAVQLAQHCTTIDLAWQERQLAMTSTMHLKACSRRRGVLVIFAELGRREAINDHHHE